jgi:hypothetical protein
MRNWIIALVGVSLLAAGCRHVSGKCDCSAGPSDAYLLTGPTNYQHPQPNAAGQMHPTHVGAPSSHGAANGPVYSPPVGGAMPMPAGR